MINSWAHIVTHYPKMVVCMVLLVLAICVSKIPLVEFDTSTRGYLKIDHPSIVSYDEFREDFGRDEFIVLAIEHDNIFSLDFLTKLQTLQQALYETVPYLEEAESLINARHIYGLEDEVIVEDLFEEWPNSSEELSVLKGVIINNPLYERLYISHDQSLTNILLRFQLDVKDDASGQWRYLEEREYNEAIPVIKSVIANNTIEGAKIYLAGSPIMVANLEESMMRDMQLFTALTILIIAFFLWFLFRSLLSVVVPLLCVVLSLLVTVAAMAWFGQPLQVPSVILPSFILAVGIGDAVHLLTIYFKNLTTQLNPRKSMVLALQHTFMPMFLTSITTAAGLFSFSQTNLVPLANLGLFSSLGVMLAFLLTVSLLPACVIIFSKNSPTISKQFEPKWISTFINRCLKISFNFPMRVILIVGCILIAGLYSASQLHFSHNPMVWIPSDWPVHGATEKVDEKMGGTVAIEMIIDTQQVNGLYNSQLMNNLDKVAKDIRRIKTPQLEPGKVLSVVEMLKETEQALHGNDPAAYRIPNSNELVAQQLFLLEMSGADDLYKLVDREYQKARISITAPWVDSQYYQALMDETKNIAQRHFPHALITTTGIIPIFGSTLTEVIQATAKSYMLAFGVISIMMILLLRSFGYGLLAMIPNLSPIIIVMGMLYWVGAPLDMFTMLIGSIAIGLSVDDTVHFMYHYKQYRIQGLNNEEAITQTLNNSGRAMLITSIVLACGFFIFTASSMNNLFFFGIFTGLTIILALLADFLLAPALLVKLHKYLHR